MIVVDGTVSAWWLWVIAIAVVIITATITAIVVSIGTHVRASIHVRNGNGTNVEVCTPDGVMVIVSMVGERSGGYDIIGIGGSGWDHETIGSGRGWYRWIVIVGVVIAIAVRIHVVIAMAIIGIIVVVVAVILIVVVRIVIRGTATHESGPRSLWCGWCWWHSLVGTGNVVIIIAVGFVAIVIVIGIGWKSVVEDHLLFSVTL